MSGGQLDIQIQRQGQGWRCKFGSNQLIGSIQSQEAGSGSQVCVCVNMKKKRSKAWFWVTPEFWTWTDEEKSQKGIEEAWSEK